MNGLIALVVAAFLAFTAIAYQEWRIDRLKTDIADYKSSVETLKKANEKNQLAIDECEDIAEQNLAEAERRRIYAERAAQRSELRFRELEGRLEATRERARSLSERIVGECPAADDPAYLDFLCSGALGCTGG